MRISSLRFKAMTIAATLVALFAVAFTVGCGGDKLEPAEMGVEDLWEMAAQADEDIESWHMELTSYYLNTQYDSGPIQSMIVDVNGEDLHEQWLLMGQVYAEFIKVDGREYSKDMLDDTWKEVEATSDGEIAGDYTSQFMELPSQASSQENVGVEVIDGRETEHFHFALSSSRVEEMFTTTTSYGFSDNGGGEVDVWIDRETYFMVRYDLVIKNVVIPEEIGLGDLRFVVDISDINQPIEIAAPI
ncbi:MAG: hypothetical protein SWK76_05665 [Actinomycetota bacterium]|nr:hypothetical protein [Actinomycetota bacterium]